MKSFNVGASFERIALDILGPLLVQGNKYLLYNVLPTFQDICLYQCRICRDFEFDKRFQCERHMLEQHVTATSVASANRFLTDRITTSSSVREPLFQP